MGFISICDDGDLAFFIEKASPAEAVLAAKPVDDKTIQGIRSGAKMAGAADLVALCDRALEGDAEAYVQVLIRMRDSVDEGETHERQF